MPQPKDEKSNAKMSDLFAGSGAVSKASGGVGGGSLDPARLGGVGNFFQSMAERDPRKRKVKVNENFASDFVLSGLGVQSSSSDDEDFVPGDDDSETGGRRSRKRKRASKEKKRGRPKGKGTKDAIKENGEAHGDEGGSQEGSEDGSDLGGSSDENDDDAQRSSDASSSGGSSDNGSDDDESGVDDSEDDDEDLDDGLDSATMTQEEDEPEMDNGVDTATEADATSPAAGPAVKICCVCLSERSMDDDEIVECDSCGISVHEGCYGITFDDSDSVHSNVSSSSTEPWFCDACKAAVPRPVCALCPNAGGIFKESDCGRWVHVVCALYIKGVSFTDPSILRGLTLYELDNELFGAKPCVLCEDVRLSYTGVCISCDAGLCKVNFHATCAQRCGLLVDANSITVTALEPDPFYAYCKHHSDKFTIKARKKNYASLLAHYKKMEKIRTSNMDALSINLVIATARTEKKLARARARYAQSQDMIRMEAWLPSIRTQNLLTKSASAMKRLIKKGRLQGDCLGVGLPDPEPVPEAFKVDHAAIKKKAHMHPMFSNEFVSYYYSRTGRIAAHNKEQRNLHAINVDLKRQQSSVRNEQNYKTNHLVSLKTRNASLKEDLFKLHTCLNDLASKTGLSIPAPAALQEPKFNHLPDGLRSPGRSNSGRQRTPKGSNSLKSPTNGGMSSSLRPRISYQKKQLLADNSSESSPIGQECDICHKRENFHKLAHCDKCLKFKHITCLSPPLRSVPKKTRFGGWMCSECHEEEQTDSQNEEMDSVPSSPALEGGDGSNKTARKSSLRDRIRGPQKYEPEVKTPPPRKRGRPKKSGSAGPSSSSASNSFKSVQSNSVDRAQSLRVKATIAQAKKRLRQSNATAAVINNNLSGPESSGSSGAGVPTPPQGVVEDDIDQKPAPYDPVGDPTGEEAKPIVTKINMKDVKTPIKIGPLFIRSPLKSPTLVKSPVRSSLVSPPPLVSSPLKSQQVANNSDPPINDTASISKINLERGNDEKVETSPVKTSQSPPPLQNNLNSSPLEANDS